MELDLKGRKAVMLYIAALSVFLFTMLGLENIISSALLAIPFTLLYLGIKPQGKSIQIAMGLSGATWAVFWFLLSIYVGGGKATMPVWIAVLTVISGITATITSWEYKSGLWTKLGSPANLIQKLYMTFALAGVTLWSVTSLEGIAPVEVNFWDIFTVAIQPGKVILPVTIGAGLIAFLWFVDIPDWSVDFSGAIQQITNIGFWLLYGISVWSARASAPIWLMALPVFASVLSHAYHIGKDEHWSKIVGGYVGLAIRWYILIMLAGGMSSIIPEIASFLG